MSRVTELQLQDPVSKWSYFVATNPSMCSSRLLRTYVESHSHIKKRPGARLACIGSLRESSETSGKRQKTEAKGDLLPTNQSIASSLPLGSQGHLERPCVADSLNVSEMSFAPTVPSSMQYAVSQSTYASPSSQGFGHIHLVR